MEGEPLVILLVENNPDHAELILRSFQASRAANKIHHVLDGKAALDYLLRQSDVARTDSAKNPQPHMILLDLRLPKIDGLEVLRKIKADEKLRRLPVVVLTTSEAEKDLASAYDNHVNSYLV